MVLWGFSMTFFEIRPFWVDEWRIIYNLKFKTHRELWGHLDFMQQFPRVFLQIIKAFTSASRYSYTALRLPSFLIGTVVIFFCWHLMNKIYNKQNTGRFLFVLILVSACPFTDYYVQIKHYTMEMLMALLALWQFIELASIELGKDLKKYSVLFASLFIAPFFSYTYPIAILPAYIILASSLTWKNCSKILPPLFFGLVGIGSAFFLDGIDLLYDNSMHDFWAHLMVHDSRFFMNFYNLFAQVGAGVVYWYLFGILGIVSFVFGAIQTIKKFRERQLTVQQLLVAYSTLLIFLVAAMSFLGKLPMGEPRLNAFTIPSIAVLIIFLLSKLNREQRTQKVSTILLFLLFAGTIGNIYSTFFASFTRPEYAKQMNIYRATQNAISVAQDSTLPIFVTPGVAWPYDKTPNLPLNGNVPGGWVLKTFPAYNVVREIEVIDIDSTAGFYYNAPANVNGYYVNVSKAMVGDGINYRILTK